MLLETEPLPAQAGWDNTASYRAAAKGESFAAAGTLLTSDA